MTTEPDRAHPNPLPPATLALALRLGADPACAFSAVGFTQAGHMKLSLKSSLWLPFRAHQTMSVRSCEFAWNARFMPLGYLAVTDALVGGIGRLDVSAFGGLPLVRAKASAALTRGELIRYLAELPLLPDAMLHNHDLAWREIDASTIAVAAGAGDTACEIVFTLGQDQRIASVFRADRATRASPPFTPMPWHGEFGDYRQQGGRWIPSSAQVGWMINGKKCLYWRGRIKDWTTKTSLG